MRLPSRKCRVFSLIQSLIQENSKKSQLACVWIKRSSLNPYWWQQIWAILEVWANLLHDSWCKINCWIFFLQITLKAPWLGLFYFKSSRIMLISPTKARRRVSERFPSQRYAICMHLITENRNRVQDCHVHEGRTRRIDHLDYDCPIRLPLNTNSLNNLIHMATDICIFKCHGNT
jgi:hypothetical protein